MSYADRFWISVALIAVSLLWFGSDLEPWAKVICAAGAVGGLFGALYLGWRHIRSRRTSP